MAASAAICVLPMAVTSKLAEVPATVELAGLDPSDLVEDLLVGQAVSHTTTLQLSLDAYGFRWFRVKSSA